MIITDSTVSHFHISSHSTLTENIQAEKKNSKTSTLTTTITVIQFGKIISKKFHENKKN